MGGTGQETVYCESVRQRQKARLFEESCDGGGKKAIRKEIMSSLFYASTEKGN